ncbi:hypothetical protein BFW01_g11779 [Lasiodiplodia theobromae]|uniref:DUF7888 domain-containing protein n=1 Tax=Lasiodiplodia hormozganensis TaxID=869390 RepID=A0AA39WGA1_9PEZI|nr:uncharacterized protein LTHEOB_10532 [Lasiodiplodia theobromae]KAF4539140.1 hypothetical protein LTHEOB_10532 [Lasiodiplodia theobromae]KAF9639973.1 hypothetical protein BFW01_g11779 [Lasiodiplodia theobromae]KAK0614836.1 hypothetical protein DIS24_g11886 [Lasiodiplodia hormozganensis]
MRFLPVVAVALATGVQASPVPQTTGSQISTAQYGQAIGYAVQGAIDAVKGIKNWNKKRESFVKAVVQGMWDRNPDRNRAPAAICYNKGYDLKVPTGMFGLRDQEVSSGPLKTDYDCFYMTGNNAFWSRGDGGSINLWTMYDGNRCRFDDQSDLYCD